MRRNFVEVRSGDFDVIAEHGIESHFQRRDAGALDFVLLQFGDPILAARACAVRNSSRSASKPSRINAAFLQRQRRFVRQSRARSTRPSPAIRRVAIPVRPARRSVRRVCLRLRSQADSLRRAPSELDADASSRRICLQPPEFVPAPCAARSDRGHCRCPNSAGQWSVPDRAPRPVARGIVPAACEFSIQRLHRLLPLLNRVRRRPAVAKANPAIAARPSA